MAYADRLKKKAWFGPSLISGWQLPHGRQLRLEASLPFGIGHNTPSKNARLDFELEF
jgi:hypothetical protein